MSWNCQYCGTENPDPDAGEHLLLRIKTAVGKSLCKKLGPDSQFWAEPQFTCEPASDGWRIIPNTEAPNETQLNGRAITSPQIAGIGDILSVGKESKGVCHQAATAGEPGHLRNSMHRLRAHALPDIKTRIN